MKCSKCNKHHESKRFKTCHRCRRKDKDYYNQAEVREAAKEYDDTAKRNGICITCYDRPAEEDRIRCRICLDRQIAYRKRLVARKAKLKTRVCLRCFRVTKRSVSLCKKCQIYCREFHRRARCSLCACGQPKHYKEQACAVCMTVVQPGGHPKAIPSVLGAWRELGPASVYDVAKAASTSTRTVLRVLSRLKAMKAVELVDHDSDTNARLWRLLVSA